MAPARHRVRVQISGCDFRADRADDDGLNLTLDGAASTPGASGGLSWTFSGKKQR